MKSVRISTKKMYTNVFNLFSVLVKAFDAIHLNPIGKSKRNQNLRCTFIKEVTFQEIFNISFKWANIKAPIYLPVSHRVPQGSIMGTFFLVEIIGLSQLKLTQA